MTICVGSVSKVDVIKHRMLPLPSRLVLNLNNCYLVFALSIDMIGLCLSHYGYSFKLKNICCSVYMNKTFYDHTPNVDGLLNLDRSDAHIHNNDTKRGKVDNDSATYLWHCRLGHIDVKRMKKLHTMDFWNHLIMNHLILANHSSWPR